MARVKLRQNVGDAVGGSYQLTVRSTKREFLDLRCILDRGAVGVNREHAEDEGFAMRRCLVTGESG